MLFVSFQPHLKILSERRDTEMLPTLESLIINLDTGILFSYANIILSALMPVVLISAGFALGMYILKQIGGAFRRLG